MSNTKSNNLGSNDQSSRSRFQGLARFGGDVLSRKAARVIAIVSKESEGPEPGDPANDINFTMNLFQEVVMELNTGIRQAYSQIESPERRVGKMRTICEEFLIPFLNKSVSRDIWHRAQFGGLVEKVPGQWRVCFVIPDLIKLLDIAARLLEIGEHRSHRVGLIDQLGEVSCWHISNGVLTRYRQNYKWVEPYEIKLALSKLFYCLRGWGLDNGLETANRKWRWNKEQKRRSEARHSFGGSQSHDQSNRNDPRDIRPYRINQESRSTHAERSFSELERNEFSQWSELPAGNMTGQPAQNVTWANVVAGQTTGPNVQNLANIATPAAEDAGEGLSDSTTWDELGQEIEGVVKSGFTGLLGHNGGANVEVTGPGSSTKGSNLRPDAPVFTPGMPIAPVGLDTMDLDEGMFE